MLNKKVKRVRSCVQQILRWPIVLIILKSSYIDSQDQWNIYQYLYYLYFIYLTILKSSYIDSQDQSNIYYLIKLKRILTVLLSNIITSFCSFPPSRYLLYSNAAWNWLSAIRSPMTSIPLPAIVVLTWRPWKKRIKSSELIRILFSLSVVCKELCRYLCCSSFFQNLGHD
jgi:hypothetical protein